MVKITGLAQATSIDGDELLVVSQPSDTVVVSASTISAAAADNSYNDSGSGFVSAGFAVGDRVTVSGFATSANNIQIAEITALTAGKMTIGGSDGDAIVDEAAGSAVTIAKWESRQTTVDDVRYVFSGAMVQMSADDTAVDCATSIYTLSFDTEVYDVGGWHAGANPTRLTVPSGVSYVEAGFTCRIDDSTEGTVLILRKNGSAVAVDHSVSADSRHRATCHFGIHAVSPGDYFEIAMSNDSDTSITLKSTYNTSFWIRRVG